jgi:hypothetical protein
VDERAERIERRFEVPILVAALLVIPVIAVERSSTSTSSSLPASSRLMSSLGRWEFARACSWISLARMRADEENGR